MSLPYFPMFPTDFEADTSHLTLAEDGAYNRLLRLCWMTPGCSVPDDPEWLAKRLRVDAETFQAVVLPVLEEFFRRRRGRWHNPRLTRIFAETNAKHKRRVEAGRKGGRPRKPLNENEIGETNAEALPKQPEPEPEPEYIHNATARARAEIVAMPGGKDRSLDDLVGDLANLCARANGGNLPTGWVGAEVGIIVGHWLHSLGLTTGEVLTVAERQLAHWGKPPYGPRSWDSAMAKFAAAKAAPPPELHQPARPAGRQVDVSAIFAKLEKDGRA